jgi:hypothetical protein
MDLSERYLALRQDTDRQGRGYKLEELVAGLFRNAHFKVERDAGAASPRQSDLVAWRDDGVYYLIEVKWEGRPSSVEHIDDLRIRLAEVPAHFVGVLISVSGFTKPAVQHVEHKRAKPVLLIDGDELSELFDYTLDLARLLREKAEELFVHGKAHIYGAEPRSEAPSPPSQPTKLPKYQHQIVDSDGNASLWLSATEGYGGAVFVEELVDIDWTTTPGFGVVLDIGLPARRDGGELRRIFEVLNAHHLLTEDGSWSVEQMDRSWHGYSAADLIDAIQQRQDRYYGMERVHHTEHVLYYDKCPLGFYTLAADLSSNGRRLWRCNLSLQLSGVPLNLNFLNILIASLGAKTEYLSFRPRHEQSVTTGGPVGTADQPLRICGLVTDSESERGGSSEQEHWVTGVIARNPYAEASGVEAPDGWPDALQGVDPLIFSLRSHHLVDEELREYRLLSWQQAYTSEASCIRLLADW